MMQKTMTPFEAGDRVVLSRARGMLKQGATGTVTKRATIKGAVEVSPDTSGHSVFVTFDGVIGIQTVPTAEIEKVAG